MRFLLDIGHPAHVHYFKNLVVALKSHGHHVTITVKKKSSAIGLLQNLGFDYITLDEKSDNLFGKAFSQIKYDWSLLRICKKDKIDYSLGVSISIAHLSLFSDVRSFVFDDDDDEVQPLFVKWGQPYATELISPDVLRGKQKRKDVVYYPGYHELAYLHPNRFIPDDRILAHLGITGDDKYFVLRFNAFKAHHDINVNGFSLEQKRILVKMLSEKGRVYITGERELSPEFEPYKININSDQIHSLIYYATMFIGDSQTMSSEAAVLGTPSIRCNSFVGRISYLEEEELRYGLTYGFKPNEFESLLEKIGELTEEKNLKSRWSDKRDRMLNDKIDVSSFWLWFIENYPESKKKYSQNPDIVNNFK